MAEAKLRHSILQLLDRQLTCARAPRIACGYPTRREALPNPRLKQKEKGRSKAAFMMLLSFRAKAFNS
jgi:hypothetical protein